MRRNRKLQGTQAFGAVVLSALLIGASIVWGGDYSWQNSHAEVIETGDLRWKPEPFGFEKGTQVRYIDYEGGSDDNDGLTKQTPWKHHPWDGRASGNAAATSGPITYVFKAGVLYRMVETQAREGSVKPYLIADESGTPDEPIRLTVDPSWGSGEAVLSGSIRIPSEWKKAQAGDVPNRMDHTDVWYIDDSGWYPMHPDWPNNSLIGDATLFQVIDGETFDLHIARDPDWRESSPNYAHDYWHQWDGMMDGLPYDDYLKGHPSDYFTGGTVWSQYTHFMSTAIPRTITHEKDSYDPETGVLGEKITYGVNEGTRYMLEDLPQFLDSPGEYYQDKETNRIYIRPWDDVEPNTAQIEILSCLAGVRIDDQSNIVISGLTFARTGGDAVEIAGNCSNITVSNCRFHHLTNNAVRVKASDEGDIMESIRITDNELTYIRNTGILVAGRGCGDPESWSAAGKIMSLEVLRNRTYETGFRQTGPLQSNVPAIDINFPLTAEIAGNFINRCLGSGLVVFGGKSGGDEGGYVVPLTRLLVHHNKVENIGLGVNDYGALALWQGGPTYAWSNIAGNAVGHWPGGYDGRSDWNLSYPIYLDGAYKNYVFNNITWQRTNNPDDPYKSTTSAYFMVFGFLNPVINNTFFRSKTGLGGSSGNRNDILGNLFVDIDKAFLANNRTGDPSLVGGGDDGSSGVRGIPTLAYGNNVFHGSARAGTLVSEPDSGEAGAEMAISADDILNMKQMMRQYPIRYPELGWKDNNQPIRIPLDEPADPEQGASAGDFRLAEHSVANNNGVEYFIPWSLAATVGEWHFNANQRDPSNVLDYHWYMTEEHFTRKGYEHLPYLTLKLSDSTLDAYTMSESEDWTKGAVLFDGSRYGIVADEDMRKDIEIPLQGQGTVPPEPWVSPEPANGYNKRDNPSYGEGQVALFPAEHRKTVDIDTTNLLVDAIIRVDEAPSGYNAVIAGKYDGTTGYQLHVTSSGTAEFRISSGGSSNSVVTTEAVTGGGWHHVLAEVDRGSGRMSIYLDGTLSNESTTTFSSSASLSNHADFIVGKGARNDGLFKGAIDFLRVCQSTLTDSRTTIEELYEWQSNGPVKYDFTGAAPNGKRDAGALESGNVTVTVPELLMAWDFAGEGDTARSVADYVGSGISKTEPSGVIVMGAGCKPQSYAWKGGFSFHGNYMSLADAIAQEQYAEFTIAPKEGTTVTIVEISFNPLDAQGDGTRSFALFSDRTGFTEGDEIAIVEKTGDEQVSIYVDGMEDVSEPVSFRIYPFGKDGGLGGIAGKDGYDLLIKSGSKVGVKHYEASGKRKTDGGVFEAGARAGILSGRGD